MSWKEWKHELDTANKDYDSGNIGKETYETRIKFDLCMIYQEGNIEMAEGIAKVHGYDIKKLRINYLCRDNDCGERCRLLHGSLCRWWRHIKNQEAGVAPGE